ncbi:MAG: pyridoxamine 5'-phosphate oxidase [Pseudomonadota bacterium]
MINKEKIAELRREFDAAPLIVDELPNNPHVLFDTWFSQILEAKLDDPTACVLATVDAQGRPDTRVVLLKDFSNEQLIFYTNYHSQKALQMQASPWVALNFYWPSLFRQVRIRGCVKKISSTASEEYFYSRPRDSQISAYASCQSTVTTRENLAADFQKYQQKFEAATIIPYPNHWGGYCIEPTEFEFWHGRNHRLHDRVEYLKSDNSWIKQTLAP